MTHARAEGRVRRRERDRGVRRRARRVLHGRAPAPSSRRTCRRTRSCSGIPRASWGSSRVMGRLVEEIGREGDEVIARAAETGEEIRVPVTTWDAHRPRGTVGPARRRGARADAGRLPRQPGDRRPLPRGHAAARPRRGRRGHGSARRARGLGGRRRPGSSRSTACPRIRGRRFRTRKARGRAARARPGHPSRDRLALDAAGRGAGDSAEGVPRHPRLAAAAAAAASHR